MEARAKEYLLTQGYKIITQNYRYKHSEIDIIVEKDEVLVFVEVKFRKNSAFGHPESFVSENQMKSILSAADQYIFENNWQSSIRFDIISIEGDNEIRHFEDAFY